MRRGDGNQWEKLYLRMCVDTGNEEVLAVMITEGRCYLDALHILGKISRECEGKLPHAL
jgi:transposase-like protein